MGPEEDGSSVIEAIVVYVCFLFGVGVRCSSDEWFGFSRPPVSWVLVLPECLVKWVPDGDAKKVGVMCEST